MSKILVVVDMQKDFINGALGSDAAENIVPRVVEIIKNFAGDIYCTLDTHGEEYLQTQEGEKLPVKHCIKATDGWRIDERVAQAVNGRAVFVEKPSFGSMELAEMLAEKNKKEAIESIEIVGLCTDICVVSNALIIKATLPEVKIIVDASACAGISQESHEAALKTMQMCQIEVING